MNKTFFFVFKAKKNKFPSSTLSQIYYKTSKDRFISLTYHQVRLSDNHTLTHFKIGWAFRHFIGCQSIKSNALFIILIPSVRRVCALRACVCVYHSIMVPEWEDVWVCLCALCTLEYEKEAFSFFSSCFLFHWHLGHLRKHFGCCSFLHLAAVEFWNASNN